MEDLGLFGPTSMAWRIHGDPSSLIGGLRALMLQALNPLAMAVVAQSSNFAADPWGRLQRTSDYVMTTTFGTSRLAHAQGARIRALHSRITGLDPKSGRTIQANDPELLTWVHNVEVDSFLAGYRGYGRRLSRAECDRYVAEMVTGAELVGLSPDDVPHDLASLSDYLAATKLEATPEARRGLKFVLNPPLPPLARPLWAIPATAAVAILPARARRLYRIPWLPLTSSAVRPSAFALCRAMNLLLPGPPILREARERAAAAA